jgi:hypothetical protein
MNTPGYAIGQAVFIRTDTVDYAEQTIPFKDLEELVRLCSEPKDNLVLEKIVVFSIVEGEPTAVTLGFIAASKGQRPGNAQFVAE